MRPMLVNWQPNSKTSSPVNLFPAPLARPGTAGDGCDGPDGRIAVFIHCDVLSKRERRADETGLDRETLQS